MYDTNKTNIIAIIIIIIISKPSVGPKRGNFS